MVAFSDILEIGQTEDQMTTRDKLLDERDIVSRFKGKLVKMIKDVNVSLMITLFRLKLDTVYCMNQWKMICYHLFFCASKDELLSVEQRQTARKIKRQIS